MLRRIYSRSNCSRVSRVGHSEFFDFFRPNHFIAVKKVIFPATKVPQLTEYPNKRHKNILFLRIGRPSLHCKSRTGNSKGLRYLSFKQKANILRITCVFPLSQIMHSSESGGRANWKKEIFDQLGKLYVNAASKRKDQVVVDLFYINEEVTNVESCSK